MQRFWTGSGLSWTALLRFWSQSVYQRLRGVRFLWCHGSGQSSRQGSFTRPPVTPIRQSKNLLRNAWPWWLHKTDKPFSIFSHWNYKYIMKECSFLDRTLPLTRLGRYFIEVLAVSGLCFIKFLLWSNTKGVRVSELSTPAIPGDLQHTPDLCLTKQNKRVFFLLWSKHFRDVYDSQLSYTLGNQTTWDTLWGDSHVPQEDL